jgi:hypothetical protein
MPKVKLSAYECRKGLLPGVCAKCAEPTEDFYLRKFSWYPPIAIVGFLVGGIIGFAILALILTKKMDVRVPMCPTHKGDWAWRRWFLGIGFLLIFGLGGAAFAIAASQQAPNDDAVGFVCLGFGLGLLVFLIPALIINNNAIRPTEITERGITLTNVHRDFIEALEEDRDRDQAESSKGNDEEVEWRQRRPRSRPVNDSDEQPRRKPRSRDDDADDDDELERRARS